MRLGDYVNRIPIHHTVRESPQDKARVDGLAAPKPRFPWLYLALADAFAWALWVPVAWTRQDYQSSPLLVAALLAGVFGPGLAAILLVHLRGDKEERRDFWRRVLDIRRIRPSWYLIPLLL